MIARFFASWNRIRELAGARKSRSEHPSSVRTGDSWARRLTMPEQFENPEETKVEDETVSDPSAQKRIDRVAEKAAEKAGKTETKYDSEHTIVTH
jgi:hypothetical protein